jgi:hypothetical protein
MNPEELALLVRNLPQAKSMDLYRLGYAIRVLYNDPRRVLEIRKHLHVGMTVKFFDTHDGSMRTGRVVAMRDRDLAITDIVRNVRHTGVPYVAIDLSVPMDKTVEEVEPGLREPEIKKPTRADFQIGDMVTFDDRYGMPIIGTLIRLNQKTATVKTETSEWRVSYALMRHIVAV